MNTTITLAAAPSPAIGRGATAQVAESTATAAGADKKSTTHANPLFAPSPLAYQFPAFDKIKDADYLPAFEKGMADHRAEVEAIANSKDAPSFDNTIVALERSGKLLSRVSRVFFGLSGANTNDEMQKIQAEVAPKLSAHGDQVVLNGKLFARIEAIHAKRDSLGLDAESKRLVERYHTDFVRAGAKLSDADKTRLKAINAEMATLGTQFNQNLLKETNAAALVVDSKDTLKGLSDGAIKTAEEAAKARKLDGKYVLPLLNTTGQPCLA